MFDSLHLMKWVCMNRRTFFSIHVFHLIVQGVAGFCSCHSCCGQMVDPEPPGIEKTQLAEKAVVHDQSFGVDLVASRIYVLVGKTGLGHEHAVVGHLRSGNLILGVADNAGALTFDMATFRADGDNARQFLQLSGKTDAGTQQQVTANMLGEDVLDVAQHPTALFSVRSSLLDAVQKPSGPPAYSLRGHFTLRGVTRPLTLRVETESDARILRLRGDFRIRQTNFKIKPYTQFGGVVGVSDELRIWGDLVLILGMQQKPELGDTK